MSNPERPDVFTEADADIRVVLPYLQSLGISPGQVRAQRTFSLRLGRGMVVNNAIGRAEASGRLDYLIVNAEGRPLFVVELKRPEEELTDDDRDQGISYARLLIQIAPFVLVTNTTDSHLYDTITAEELTSPEASAFYRAGYVLSSDEDVRIRAEALRHFVGYSQQNVELFSKSQHAQRMSALTGSRQDLSKKFIPEVYVAREGVREAVGSFVRSRSVVFALGGASGSGKTNEMCALATEFGADHVALFFNGTELHEPLAKTLADEFNWEFSQELSLPAILQRVDYVGQRTSRPVLVFIDAVDEAEIASVERQLSDLAVQLSRFEGRVKLLVSLKEQEWPRFVSFRGSPAPLVGALFRWTTGGGTAGTIEGTDAVAVSLSLSEFTESELDHVLPRYADVFQVPGEWQEGVREAASDPFLLRVVAEVAREQGVLPTAVDELQLMRRYVDKKLDRMSDRHEASEALVALAKATAQHGAGGGAVDSGRSPSRRGDRARFASIHVTVPEDIARRDDGRMLAPAVINELVSFGLVVRYRDADGRARLAFVYDRVRDYLIAVHVLRLDGLTREEMRDAALHAFGADVLSSSLLWFLPRLTPQQWRGFVDGATSRVERFVAKYDQLRNLVAPSVRVQFDPDVDGPVAAVFAGVRPQGWFSLALIPWTHGTPKARHLPEAFRSDHPPVVGGVELRIKRTRGSIGFWFLRRPEEYAATLFIQQLENLVKKGGLVDSEDEFLLQETVLAIAVRNLRALGLTEQPVQPDRALADSLYGSFLLPLDLAALRLNVQSASGAERYRNVWVRGEVDRVRSERAAEGISAGTISLQIPETVVRDAATRAIAEARAGASFHVTPPQSEYDVLAMAIDRLLANGRSTIERLLPPPDERGAIASHVFDRGFTDSQLAAFFKELFEKGLVAYGKISEASFDGPLRTAVQALRRTGAVVHFARRPVADPIQSQFGGSITLAFLETDEDGTPFVEVSVDPAPNPVRETETEEEHRLSVVTSAGERTVSSVSLIATSSVVWPYDAPPYAGIGGAARLAPVRAVAYSLIQEDVEQLTVERLLAVAST